VYILRFGGFRRHFFDGMERWHFGSSGCEFLYCNEVFAWSFLQILSHRSPCFVHSFSLPVAFLLHCDYLQHTRSLQQTQFADRFYEVRIIWYVTPFDLICSRLIPSCSGKLYLTQLFFIPQWDKLSCSASPGSVRQ
jgi:hypothetical protein